MENEIIKRFRKLLVEDQLSQPDCEKFILSELKALKEECVGKKRIYTPDMPASYKFFRGYNKKREEIIKAFEKRGI